MSVARLKLAPTRATMLPSCAPFFLNARLGAGAAHVGACAEDEERVNLPVPPSPLPHAHRPKVGL
jgi:hypothetical protein